MSRADLAALRALVRLVEHELGERLDRGQLDDRRLPLIASDARHLQAAAGSLRERLDDELDDRDDGGRDHPAREAGR